MFGMLNDQSTPVRSIGPHFSARQLAALWGKLATAMWCHAKALRHGVYLLPLPLYWDALQKINWAVLQSNDPEVSEMRRVECRKYLIAREIAYFSDAHENVLSEHLEYCDELRGKPVRPKWFR